MSSLFLSQAEVDRLCFPLTRADAQRRFIARLLGLPDVPHRPDGRPIVGREILERRLGGQKPKDKAPAPFNWSS